MLISDCISCQWGDHDGCMGVYQKPPPGLIGGAMCGCKGDCAERYKKSKNATIVKDLRELYEGLSPK